jgi:hypothetical protein
VSSTIVITDQNKNQTQQTNKTKTKQRMSTVNGISFN